MALVINTNMFSLTAQNNLSKTQTSMSQAIERLSSGLRINSAADDAAGYAIAQNMTTQVNGLNQAARNANDGISLVQTATGAVGQIVSNLQQIRTLAIEGLNSTNSGQRDKLNTVAKQLLSENTRIVNQTKFNGTSLLSSALGKMQFQVGSDSGDTIKFSGITNVKTTVSAAAGVTLSTSAGLNSALTKIDKALSGLTTAGAQLGAYQNRFEAVVSNLQDFAQNMTAARSRITDADFAAETANLTRAQILQQAGTAMVAQANQLPQLALRLLQ